MVSFLFADCGEVPEDGVFTIQPYEDSPLISAVCVNEKQYVQLRPNQPLNTPCSPTWDDMKAGITSSCFFWIGVENLYHETLHAYCRLTIQLSTGIGQFHAIYDGFRVENEANNYTLHYDFFNSDISTAGDGFAFYGNISAVLGNPFQASDTSLCSGIYGWWFSDICPITALNAENAAMWPVDSESEEVASSTMYLQVLYYL